MGSQAPHRFWMLVVYRNPGDYPGMYVARGWSYASNPPIADQKPTKITTNADAMRLYIKDNWPWMVRLEPAPLDDPCIYEVWI